MVYAGRKWPAGGRLIDITFATKRLEKACSTTDAALREWGDSGRTVLRRLALLRAADSLGDLANAPGKLHALTGDRREQFAMSITRSLRLVLEVSDVPVPRLDDGGIDRARVTKLRVKEVVNYHGD